MATIDERFAALERRIALLEDQVAIYQLMAAYGPAADSGSTDRATTLWAEDGIYDLHSRVMTGRGEIAQGSGHIVSMPHVVVEGDQAVATCHSRLYRREGEAYRVISCSANRWEFVRGARGWQVKRRISRRLDGSEGSHALLAEGINARRT